jgi:hypothetical protein
MPAATIDANAGPAAQRSDAESADRGPLESGDRSDGSNDPLERVAVNVTGRASRALDLATELTGDTKTDTLNRALQVYAYLEQLAARGGSVYVREAAGSQLELLKVL